ncbi:MAG: type II toxin-antitoxin system VapC family toxin [Gammaproteobacteria bacterium]
MILVDTNVILDVVQDDPVWADWSQQQLEMCSFRDSLCINPVIYAEVSMAFARIEELERALAEAEFALDAIPKEALFLAGKVFLQYRKSKGAKSGVLSDFFVGAHAAVDEMTLLTRDVARYRTYFPKVKLISPS